MSLFSCPVLTLTAVEPHPNADKLELAVVGGYRAVVQKGVHRAGDRIVYLPTDSVIPTNVADGLGIAAYLGGPDNNRVKAIKLRGMLSEGIVVPVDAVVGFLTSPYRELPLPDVSVLQTEMADAAPLLSITKYEEVIPEELQGIYAPWPSYIPSFSVENLKRPEFVDVFTPDEPVIATEKLHGMWTAVGLDLDAGGVATVCCAQRALVEQERDLFWTAVRRYRLIEGLRDYAKTEPGILGAPARTLVLYGETLGGQHLKYGFTRAEPGFAAFGFSINGVFVPDAQLRVICGFMEVPVVPKVYEGPFDMNVLRPLAEGQSTLAPHIREGIIVAPAADRTHPRIGRIQMKLIGGDYLTGANRTEYH